mgnify:CR=1 FL=1
MRNPKAISQNKNRSDNDYIKSLLLSYDPYVMKGLFSFYLVDLLKEYCFIE